MTNEEPARSQPLVAQQLLEMRPDWMADETWDGVGLGYVPLKTRLPADAPAMHEKREEPDPVTYQVLRWKLWAINLEHSDTIKRVSGSPAIVYMDDFATAILTSAGDNVVTGPTIQYFTGLADLIVKWTLEYRSKGDGIGDGDVFLQNDPYIGAAHQIDTALYMPLFWRGKIVCWLFNAAHQGDLGGISPGSFCVSARDVFDEPTPVPPVRIIREGKLQNEIVELFTRKSRTPDLIALQLRSQIAGLNTAKRRLTELLDRYGPAILAGTMDRMISDCERVVGERLLQLPDGVFSHIVDVAGLSPDDKEVHRYRLEIRKEGSVLVCTNAGTDPQHSSGNCTYSAWRSAIICAASSIFAHDQLSCPAGVLAHLQFEPHPGLLTCARYPGAVTTIISTTISVNLANIVLGKMALLGPPEIAQSAIAAGAASVLNSWVLSAVDQTGRRIADVTGDGIAGGFGASRYRDGIDNGGAWFMPGNVAGDTEEWEQSLPVLYLYRRECTDSGGPGRLRGGNGLAAAICGHKIDICQVLTLNVDTSLNATPGLAGGMPGHTGDFSYRGDTRLPEMLQQGRVPANRTELEDLVGAAERLSPMASARLLARDVFMTQVCGGGGVGDPLDRKFESVAEDITNRSVSAAMAESIYGVVVQNGIVDQAATTARRTAMRTERLTRSEPPVSRFNKSPIATKSATNLQVGDALHLRGDALDMLWICGSCEEPLGPANENYRLYARVLRPSLSEFPRALYPLTPQGREPDFELRQYICPHCATLIATDFCRVGEEHREDIVLKQYHARSETRP